MSKAAALTDAAELFWKLSVTYRFYVKGTVMLSWELCTYLH